MNVIVVIEGREAIPVRAIPFLTAWEKMIPDDVANALAWGKSYRKFKKLRAFHIENVQRDIPAIWWENNTCLELNAQFYSIKAANAAYDHNSQDWRRKSLEVLPSGVFVWKDEFEPGYFFQYGPEGEIMCDSTELSGLMPEDEQERRVALDFDPFIPDAEIRRVVMEGFEPKTTTPSPAPAPQASPVAVAASETKEQRQDRRLQACIEAGLPMDAKAALLRLPDGVGNVADREDVTRQAFSTDVKAALKRRESAIREGGTVHRT